MRGCDGNLIGWNGSAESLCGGSLYMARSMEFGAYVLNSDNSASGCDGYFQKNLETVYPPSSHVARSSKPEFAETYHQSMASKDFLSPRHPSALRRTEQMTFSDRYSPVDVRNQGTHRSVTAGQGLSNRNKNAENNWSSNHDANCSGDNYSSENIYEGPVVRVQVPEVYTEPQQNDSTARYSGTVSAYSPGTYAVAYSRGVSYNEEDRMAERHHLNTRETTNGLNICEVYNDQIASETYSRIKDWLKSCQQHTKETMKSPASSVAHKLNSASHTPNKPTSANHLHPNSVSNHPQAKHFSRPHLITNHSSEITSMKYQGKEPQVVAALESRGDQTRQVINHQQRTQSMYWSDINEGHLYEERQTYVSRNFNIMSSKPQKNSAHPVGKLFLESEEFSRTSSEWSSETLSICDSDKSSYCTDFTPFEFQRNSVPLMHQHPATAYSCDFSSNGNKQDSNLFVSQITVDKINPKENIPQKRDFSETPSKPFAKSSISEKWIHRDGNFNWNPYAEKKSMHQHLQKVPTENKIQTQSDFQPNWPNLNVAHKSNVVIHDRPNQQHDNVPEFGRANTSGFEIHKLLQQRRLFAAHRVSVEAEPSPKTFEIYNEDRKSPLDVNGTRYHKVKQGDKMSSLVSGDSYLCKDETRARLVPDKIKIQFDDKKSLLFPIKNSSHDNSRKWISASRGFFDDRPMSTTRIIMKDQPLSCAPSNSTFLIQPASRPSTQLRGGSLSITIRPSRPTILTNFTDIEDDWNSAGNKGVSSSKVMEVGSLSSDSDLEQDVMNQAVEDPENLFDDMATIEERERLISSSGEQTSDESADLDMFTQTVIKADIPGRSGSASLSAPESSVKLKGSWYTDPGSSPIQASVRSMFSRNPYDMLENQDPYSHIIKKRHGDSFEVKNEEQFPEPTKALPSNTAFKEHFEKLCSDRSFFASDVRCDAEYMNHSEQKNLSDVDHTSDTERKCSKLFVPLVHNKSKTLCIVKTLPSSPLSNTCHSSHSGDQLDKDLPRMVSMGTKDPVKTASPSVVPSDMFQTAVTKPDANVNCEASSDESISKDTLLMSLLQNHSSDLPEFQDFSVPRPQSQSLVRTTHFTLCSKCTDYNEDSKYTIEKSKVQDFYEGLDFASGFPINPPKMFSTPTTATENETTGRVESEDINCNSTLQLKLNEFNTACDHCSDNELSEGLHISGLEHFLPGLEQEKLMRRPKECSRRWSQNSKSAEPLGTDREQGSVEIVSAVPDRMADESCATKSQPQKKDVNEPLSCQEVIELPLSCLKIEPPESFSDFTIYL